MNEKILKALTALAEKLGTTAEYLWGVLVKQAPINGVIDLLVITGWITGFFICLKIIRKNKVESEGLMLIAYVSTIVFAIGSVGFTTFLMSDMLSAFFNPEYWALHKILPGKCGCGK